MVLGVCARMGAGVLAAAAATVTMAVPASAQAPTPPPKNPGVRCVEHCGVWG